MAGSPVFLINFTNRLIPAKPNYRMSIKRSWNTKWPAVFQDCLTILNWHTTGSRAEKISQNMVSSSEPSVNQTLDLRSMYWKYWTAGHWIFWKQWPVTGHIATTFWFCRELFVFAVSFLFLPWVFGFAVSFLVLPWASWFCRELFGFAVLPWGICYYRDSCGPPYHQFYRIFFSGTQKKFVLNLFRSQFLTHV